MSASGSPGPPTVKQEPGLLPVGRTTIGGVQRAKFAPKLPIKQRERKTNADAASPTSASLSASPSASSVKSEYNSRHDRVKAPDRVAFVAASKEGFTRMSGASAGGRFGGGGGGGGGGDDDDKEEGKRSRLTKLVDRMNVDDDGTERKSGLDERIEESEDSEADDDELNRYKPISVPFRKQRSSAPTTAASSPYPPRSAATIITKPAPDTNNLLFFQLPSHLPLQPTNAPTTSSTTTTTASSATLPGKPPTLTGSSASSTNSFLANKTLMQKKKLLTFDPQFQNSLQFVPSGSIGRLLVYRSGRVKIEIGGVKLDVERGTDCLYHQQVVSVQADAAAEGAEATAGQGIGASGRREWVELGDVRERLVCTMDVDDLQRKKDRRERAGAGGGGGGGGRRAGERNDEKAVGGDVKMKEERI